MPRKLLISALGTTVAIDLQGLTDAAAGAIRNVWRDALAERVDPPVVERAIPPVVERAIPPVVERAKRDETQHPLPTVIPAASSALEDVLADLSQRVTLTAIGARRGQLWMLHAAGVATDDGRVVALVGPSGRGKTTAAHALGEHFGYVSDETVAIDDRGRVWPYRKPLSVIEGTGPKAQRSPTDLQLRPLPDAPLRLAAVVLLDRRDDGPDEPLVEPVELGDALEALVAQSSYLADMPAPLRTMAALVESAGGVHRVTYREASTLAAALSGWLSEPNPRSSSERSETKRAEPARDVPRSLSERSETKRAGLADAHPRSLSERSETKRAGHADAHPRSLSERSETKRAEPARDATLWFRAPVHDELALHDPDHVALLQTDAAGQGTVRVLAGVAPALWRAADAASVDDLVAAAVAAYGEPPGADAESLVRSALADLAAAGLLEERPH